LHLQGKPGNIIIEVIVVSQTEHIQNLILVAAVDGYARKHNISPIEAFDIFEHYGLFEILRDNYETLHTQELFEGARFADDYIVRHTA
jgi:hypothetical protein